MKLLNSSLLLNLTALNLVFAAAVPQPQPQPQPEPAAEAKAAALTAPGNATTTLEKRDPNGANCWRYHDGYSSYFRLSTWGEWDQDWGKGLWDNIRGQCGFNVPDQWWFAFEQGPPPTNGMAQVRMTDAAYGTHCIHDAVWLASNYRGGAINGMVCWESNKWW